MMSHTFDSDKNKNYLMFRNLGDGNDGALIPCTIVVIQLVLVAP